MDNYLLNGKIITPFETLHDYCIEISDNKIAKIAHFEEFSRIAEINKFDFKVFVIYII